MNSAPVKLLINIDVDDLEAAIDFYQRAADLRLGRRLFGKTVAELIGGSAPIFLLQKEPGTSPTSAHTTQRRDYRRHWTPVHLDIVVADIDVAIEKAVAAGAWLEGEPQSFEWGRLATLHDPFGHGFDFVQWKGDGYDAVA